MHLFNAHEITSVQFIFYTEEQQDEGTSHGRREACVLGQQSEVESKRFEEQSRND